MEEKRSGLRKAKKFTSDNKTHQDFNIVNEAERAKELVHRKSTPR